MEVSPKLTSNKPGGSDVTTVIGKDHALAAQKYLEDNGYADRWQVVLADDKTFMLDYDDKPYDGILPEQFYTILHILYQAVGSNNYFETFASKGGNTHVVIHLEAPMPIVERIAWQAAFGSDPQREALHLLNVSRGELNPILLFGKKQKGTT